jgi:hypothetical protein
MRVGFRADGNWAHGGTVGAKELLRMALERPG